MAYRFINPSPQFFTNNGVAIVNGTLTFYEPGTTTFKNTYPTQALSSPNVNPITLNSVGSSPVEIWMDGEYRVVLKNALGVVVWDRDPYSQTFLTDAQPVENVADLISAAGTFDGQTVNLLGYYAVGDAPARTMYWDAASTADHDGGRVFQATGVPTGRWKSSITDFMDLRLWGLKADCPDYPSAPSGTDNYDVFNRALNSSLRTSVIAGINIKQAGTFLFPEGGIAYVSQTLHCKNVFSLIGGGSHIGNDMSCQIRNPTNIGGIVLHEYNTDSSGTVAAGSSAAGSVIDGISFRGNFWPSSTGTVGHGIWLRTRAVLRNINIRGYAQNGVNIVATAGGGGFNEGNVNNWFADNVRSIDNGGHGWFVDGADANAGVGINCHGDANVGWGIYESSFLGNTWIETHTAGNTLGGYKSDGINTSTIWINPYAEGDQDPSEFDQASLVLGSTLAVDPTKLGVVVGPIQGKLQSSKPVSVRQFDANDDLHYTELGGAVATGTILYVSHPTVAANPFLLRSTGKDIVWDYNAGTSTYLITGPDTTQAFGRTAPVPHALGVRNLFTRADSFGRQITHASAAPTTGNWAQGDVVFNTGAAVGQPKGWQCTVTGTPGTWVSMGNL